MSFIEYGISTDALSFTEVANEFVEGDRVLKPTTLFSVEVVFVVA
jgi:hypothetical protein